MMYKKLSWLTYIFSCILNKVYTDDNERLLNFERSSQSYLGNKLTAPKITFTDVGPDYINLQVTVTNGCRLSTGKDKNNMPFDEFIVQFAEEGTNWQDLLEPLNRVNKSTWNFSINRLKPETSYNIRSYGCRSKNEGNNFPWEFTTTTCKPLEILDIITTINTVEITFKRDSLSCKSSNYDFKVSPNAPSNRLIHFNDKTYCVLISNLLPGTEYTFFGDLLNNQHHSITKKVRTDPENAPTENKIIFHHWEPAENNFTYTFTWSIPDKDFFGNIESYQMFWDSHHKACKPNQAINKNTQISRDIKEYSMELDPYTEYNFTLNVFGSRSKASQKDKTFSTRLDDNFNDEEKPTIEYVEPNPTSVKIIFKYLDCTKLGGPLLLNYEVYGAEYWCDSIPLKTNIEIKFPFQNKRMIIPSLTAYCTYTIQMYYSRTNNNWEHAASLEKFTIKTKSIVISEAIQELTVVSQGRDHVHLRWKQPTKPNGLLEQYYISTYKGDYFAPINKTVKPCKLWPEYQCHDLEKKDIVEFHNFDISVIGINENDLNDSAFKEAIHYAKNSRLVQKIGVYTAESEPNKPYDVKATWTDHSLLNVSWKHPNQTNGILQLFELMTTVEYNDNFSVRSNVSYPINNDTNDYKFEYSKVINVYLKPEQKYLLLKVLVTAQNIAGKSRNPDVFTIKDPPPPKNYAGEIKMAKLVLKIPKPQNDIFFEKMVIFKAELSKADGEGYTRELKKIQELLETSTGQSEIKKVATINQWIDTYSGDNKNQPIVINGSKKSLFQNNTQYKIALFIVNEVNGKRKVRKHIKKVKSGSPDEPDELPSKLVLQIIILLVILFAFPFLAYLAYRFRHKLLLQKSIFGGVFQGDSTPEDVTLLAFMGDGSAEDITNNEKPNNVTRAILTKPIHSKQVKVDDLGKYIKKSLKNGEFQRQHQLFPRSEELMQQDETITCNYGSLPVNKTKNRYNKIIAYDHTRVILNKMPGDEYSDYINANYINGYKLPKAYIATQGPKKNTINDFWRMIWQHNVGSIVMLSNLYKGDKKECEVYWPEDNSHKNYNGIEVEFVGIKRYPTYDVRDFKVHCDGYIRRLSQIQFKSWPAVGQLIYPQTLVPLMQKMLTLPYLSRSPIVVHCSAGIGRTGTVILCDICLRMAAAEGAVDVLGMLERLRAQRPNMVDNVEQYKLAHLVVLACLTDWNTSIPCDGKFETVVEGLLQDGIISSNMTYLKESEWQDDAMKSVAVPEQVPVVPEKNRYSDIVPEEHHQIFLELLPNRDQASTYINAIRVNSFSFSDRYIVTQQPLPASLGDFWRTVVEQQCIVVINLNEIDSNDTTSVPFWPEEESKMSPEESLEIQHVKTHNAKEFSIVTVRIWYRPNDFEQTKLTVEILNFKAWPNHLAISDNMDHFVSFVADSMVICRKSHPVIVTCHDGATASGLFVAMSNLIEQMKQEKQCDICKTVRTIRNCRKQFVDKEAQLSFLYNAAVFYLNNFGVYQDVENF